MPSLLCRYTNRMLSRRFRGRQLESVMKKEAAVVCAKCAKYKKLFGVRAEKRGSHWAFTWAFTLSEGSAQREGYNDTRLSGGFIHDEEYPGCPFCHAPILVQCGGCGRLACYDQQQNLYTCPFCANQAEVVTADWDEVDGGGL